MTLNGWMLHDGEVIPVPEYDLRSGGRDWWDEAYRLRATVFRIIARRGQVELQAPREGNPRLLFLKLAYMTRELVNLTKLEYDPARRQVHWWSYHDNERTTMSVHAFKHGLEEYEVRLGRFGNYQARNIHRRFGHLAEKRIKAMQEAAGGRRLEHRVGCPCGRCKDWEPVTMEELSEAWVH